MPFNLANLETAVEILVLGWGGVFIVMLVIYLVSLLLGRMFPPNEEE